MKSFTQECRILPCYSYVSGTADVTSTVIDTKGFDSVAIVVHLAAIATGSVCDLFLQEADAASNSSTLTSGADLAGSSVTVADDDDNQVFVIEVCKPLKRFLQLTINKDASNAVAASAVAYLYNADAVPTTHAEGTGTSGGTAVVTVERHVSPIAGTK